LAPDLIRKFWYALAAPTPAMRIADLGNLTDSETMDEVYDKISYVIEHILRIGKTVLFLGGTNDLVWPIYRAFEQLEMPPIDYVSIDSMLDLRDADLSITNHSFNNQIVRYTPNYLNSFSNLGTQSYFVTESERKALRDLNFDSIRVGDLHTNIRLGEPYLRQAHMVSFDMNVVRHAEAPGVSHPSPAGLTADEICQLARFAGMGYHLQVAAVTEVNPMNDLHDQTAHLAALVLWYVAEGFYHRRQDKPNADRSNVRRYTVELTGAVRDITFYYSEQTDRWWMEVPDIHALDNKGGRKMLVPCPLSDYETALQNEIPDRWWQAHFRFGQIFSDL
jgi:arginase family enzyme